MCHSNSTNCITIPCTYDVSFSSFEVSGITQTTFCTSKQSDIFALIYNYLLRSTKIKLNNLSPCVKNIISSKNLKYQYIYEMAIVMLLLIKNNIFDKTIKMSTDLPEEYIANAVLLINDYGMLFGQITRKGYIPIKYVYSSHFKVSVNGNEADISITHSNKKNYSREIWFGRRISYQLGEDDRSDCELILREISPYHNFAEGQFEAMCSILNASGNSVCIMPTGSGKSLVFYMVSFLQPMPVLVIAPTDILISDQIRNLRETHNIDDVSHLRNSSDSDFKNFDVCTKFIYMTPSTFQNRDFLSKCIFLNSGTQLNGLREEKVTPDSKLVLCNI